MMNTKKTNDVADLTRQGVTTFLNIGLMARYMYLYYNGKELQNDSPAQVNAYELAQNRDKMIKYTILSGDGILSLLTMGVVGLMENSRNDNRLISASCIR